MKQACPNCADGYVWTREGPTGKACPTCKGRAYIGEDEQCCENWPNCQCNWDEFDADELDRADEDDEFPEDLESDEILIRDTRDAYYHYDPEPRK